MRQIYLAGKFEAQDRLRHERDRIHQLGVGKVVGTWLDEESAPGEITAGTKYIYAVRDREEVLDSDLLILDTLDENNRGGREVEFGIALGRGIEVWVVGPKRNVFHEMAPQFESWNEVIEALAREAA
jgi:hypothetical protein